MPKTAKNHLALGDLVAAAYDCAEMVTSDKSTVDRLASRTLARWLVQTDRLDLAEALVPQASAIRPTRSVRPARAVRAARRPRTAKAA